MGLPKGPEGQGLPEVRTSVPDTLGLLGREGRARGGGQGQAWGGGDTVCGCSGVPAPRRALSTLEGQLTCPPVCQGASCCWVQTYGFVGPLGTEGTSRSLPRCNLTHHEVPWNSYLGLSGGPSRCETGSPRPRLCAQESQQSRDESGGTVLAPRVQRAVTLGRTPSAGSRWTTSHSFLSGRNATYPACSLLPLPPVPRAGEDEGSLGALRTSG